METKKAITKEMRTELRKDFPKEAYSQHPTKKFLTTLKAMYVTERLNNVFGVGRWSIEHSVIERTNDYVLIQGSFISLDYEVIVPSQYGGHKTSGTNTEIADGYKSAITDCISKIASYLEIGIDMFKGKIKPNKITSPNKPQEPQKKWINKQQLPKIIEWMSKNNKNPEDMYKYYNISKDIYALLEANYLNKTIL